MIHITEAAAKKAKEFITEYSHLGLRFGITGGGCAGFEYSLSGADKEQTGDIINEEHGVKVYCDPKSYLFLNETTIDYAESLMGAGFKFINPNSKGTCGCNKSFSV
jgi:iron-sulfur cluster assembly protein